MKDNIYKKALDLFGITEEQLTRKLSGGTYNAVYEFEKDSEQFVIRIGELEFDIETTNGMIESMLFFEANGAAVPKLKKSIQNNPVEYIHSKDRIYSVNVYKKVSGENARNKIIKNQDLSWARAFGQAVGKIHELAKTSALKNTLRVRPHWNQLGSDFNPPMQLSVEEMEIQKRRTDILNQLMDLPKTPDVYGLVHGDLHLGNILVHTDSSATTLLDFDDLSVGWFMMDLVAPITDLWVCYSGQNKADIVNQYLDEALAGYQHETQLSFNHISQIPLLLELLEIGLYTRFHKMKTLQEENWWVKTFMTDRKERIEAGVPFVELQIGILNY